METHISSWFEIRRAVGQWAGIVLSAIVSGVVLGVLVRHGVAEKLALEYALPIGCVFAIVFWVSIVRSFSGKRNIQIPVPISSNVSNIEGQITLP